MRTALVTPPAAEPVALDQAKAHLRLEVDADDDLVTDLIVAARQACEAICRSAFITQTWDLLLDHWPHAPGLPASLAYRPTVASPSCGWREPIYLPLAPLQRVVSLSYYDQSGTLQTLDASQYLVGATNQATTPGRVSPLPLGVWPWHQAGRPDAIQVRFSCGYGDDGSAVPACVRVAIKTLVALYYEGRETPGDVPPGVVSLLSPACSGSYT